MIGGKTIIGIMSDSHDNLGAIKKAVNFFNQEKVDLVIHAGDLISPFTVQQFQRLKSPFIAIFGNNDGERDGLREAYKNLCFLEDFKEILVEDKKVAIIHGTNQALVDSLSSCGKYQLVIRGHSHQPEVIGGETMVVNPGETCGYLTGNQTVVLMDPVDLSYKVIHL